MELPITQHTTEEFLITLQSTALSAEFQITTNELCIELPITLQTTEQFRNLEFCQ
jgi:hypothetical protein